MLTDHELDWIAARFSFQERPKAGADNTFRPLVLDDFARLELAMLHNEAREVKPVNGVRWFELTDEAAEAMTGGAA